MFEGKNAEGKEILVCTPQSRLHVDGKGWVDLTNIQVSKLKEADYSILALRIEGNKEYYILFNNLEPFLTAASMYYNDREGDHWKLYIAKSYSNTCQLQSYADTPNQSFRFEFRNLSCSNSTLI